MLKMLDLHITIKMVMLKIQQNLKEFILVTTVEDDGNKSVHTIANKRVNLTDMIEIREIDLESAVQINKTNFVYQHYFLTQILLIIPI